MLLEERLNNVEKELAVEIEEEHGEQRNVCQKNYTDELAEELTDLAAALALAFFHVFFLLITMSWSRQSQAETDRAALRA